MHQFETSYSPAYREKWLELTFWNESVSSVIGEVMPSKIQQNVILYKTLQDFVCKSNQAY